MFVLQDSDSGQYWGRGRWWQSIYRANLYTDFLRAENASEKAMEKWGDDQEVRIIKVAVTITPVDGE